MGMKKLMKKNGGQSKKIIKAKRGVRVKKYILPLETFIFYLYHYLIYFFPGM
jgi:hypothetical protein